MKILFGTFISIRFVSEASAGIEDMRNIKNNHFVPARENELRERIPVPHVWLAVCTKIQ